MEKLKKLKKKTYPKKFLRAKNPKAPEPRLFFIFLIIPSLRFKFSPQNWLYDNTAELIWLAIECPLVTKQNSGIALTWIKVGNSFQWSIEQSKPHLSIFKQLSLSRPIFGFLKASSFPSENELSWMTLSAIIPNINNK